MFDYCYSITLCDYSVMEMDECEIPRLRRARSRKPGSVLINFKPWNVASQSSFGQTVPIFDSNSTWVNFLLFWKLQLKLTIPASRICVNKFYSVQNPTRYRFVLHNYSKFHMKSTTQFIDFFYSNWNAKFPTHKIFNLFKNSESGKTRTLRLSGGRVCGRTEIERWQFHKLDINL